jgi:hypothetical protein
MMILYEEFFRTSAAQFLCVIDFLLVHNSIQKVSKPKIIKVVVNTTTARVTNLDKASFLQVQLQRYTSQQ